MHPFRALTAFHLFETHGLPEPTKADKRKGSRAFFHATAVPKCVNGGLREMQNMYNYLLRAKRDLNGGVVRDKDKGKLTRIPKGYTIQVPSARTGSPDPKDVERVLLALGFGPSVAYSARCAGNWDVTKL